MPPQRRGPLCGETNPEWCSTPGTTGILDQADVDRPIWVRSDRNSRGVISLAEEGELVLAKAGKGSGVPAGGAQSKEVVLTSIEPGWYQWAVQFEQHAKSSRSKVPFAKKPSQKQILAAYEVAAKRVGLKGLLIVSAGHGYAKGFTSGAVDLAPAGQLGLSSHHFNIKADPSRTLQKKDQQMMETFVDIGKILRQYKVPRVLFLSCNVGQSHDFLQEIADEWQTTVGGYVKLLDVGTIFVKTRKRGARYGVYFPGSPPRTEQAKLESTRNYPTGSSDPFQPIEIWWVKPSKNKAAPPTK